MKKQKPKPAPVSPFVSPCTIMLKIVPVLRYHLPNKNPLKLPIANKNPTAVPYPTGNTNSHPNSNIIGTKGIRKNELNADTKLAHTKESVSSRG
jgi:hypothetical protein